MTETTQANCRYRITNGLSGFRWTVDALEDSLKSFCDFHGLELETFKSGFLFRHLSFVISGVARTEQDGRKVLEQVEGLVRKYE